jgi:hypothetical protein
MVHLRSVLSPTIVNRFFVVFTGAAALAVILRYCFFGWCCSTSWAP